MERCAPRNCYNGHCVIQRTNVRVYRMVSLYGGNSEGGTTSIFQKEFIAK